MSLLYQGFDGISSALTPSLCATHIIHPIDTVCILLEAPGAKTAEIFFSKWMFPLGNEIISRYLFIGALNSVVCFWQEDYGNLINIVDIKKEAFFVQSPTRAWGLIFPWEKNWPPWLLTVSSPWVHGELTVTKMVTASRDWAMTWAVIELWPRRDRRDWAVTSPWLSCDLAVTELWPRRDWAVT